jgi:hypothetical protein
MMKIYLLPRIKMESAPDENNPGNASAYYLRIIAYLLCNIAALYCKYTG